MEMTTSSIHLLIIWSKAQRHQVDIEKDINNHFECLKKFSVQWSRKLYKPNFRCFYAFSLKENTPKEVDTILKQKELDCGNGPFTVYIIKDNNPVFQKHENNSSLVNENAFSFKMRWRDVAGGSRIHCSDNEYETNRNLSVLFGISLSDFKKNPDIINISQYNQNCIGVNGYETLDSFFFILNNNIKYCVLRNFDDIYSQSESDLHKDIDLLVEHKNFIIYLTGAKPVRAEAYRVLHTISIAQKEVYFDFRYLGDNYYDYLWEKDILESRVQRKKHIWVPNEENHFYSLLYHALIQKKAIASDYIERLNSLSIQIINKDLGLPSTTKGMAILDNFISKKNYSYTKPIDSSVFFNYQNIKQTKCYHIFGIPFKSSYVQDSNGTLFWTSIFKKENVFIKNASKIILDNEAQFLEQLKQYEQFPKIVSRSEQSLTITSIPGITLQSLVDSKKHLSLQHQKSLLLGIIDILEILYSERIIHRDFTLGNILIDTTGTKYKVSLIDFGWATHFDKESTAITPIGLGENYKKQEYFSDAFAFAQILKIRFPKYPYLINSTKFFEKIALIPHPTSKDLNEIRQFISKRNSFFSIAIISLRENLIGCKFFSTNLWRKIIYPLHFRLWISKIKNFFGIVKKARKKK